MHFDAHFHLDDKTLQHAKGTLGKKHDWSKDLCVAWDDRPVEPAAWKFDWAKTLTKDEIEFLRILPLDDSIPEQRSSRVRIEKQEGVSLQDLEDNIEREFGALLSVKVQMLRNAAMADADGRVAISATFDKMSTGVLDLVISAQQEFGLLGSEKEAKLVFKNLKKPRRTKRHLSGKEQSEKAAKKAKSEN
jgi:hypothetical protein